MAMNRNNILIALIIIVVIILGVFVFTQLHSGINDDGKVSTEIKFLSADALKNGEAVQFQLKDKEGNALSGQNVTIIFTEEGTNQTYAIITDNDGKGSLVLNNEAPGSYDVRVYYKGNIRYDGCSAKQTIKIEEGTAETSSSSDSSEQSTSTPVQSNSSAGTSLYNGNSSSQGQLHYDSQYNFYYDDNGIIRGGQSDGMSADYVRNSYSSGDMIDEEGNLQ